MHLKAQRRIIVPFLLPGMVLLAVFFLYPLVRTVDISLSEFSRTGISHFVGVDNYAKLFGDGDYYNALKNTFLMAFIGGCMLFPPAVAVAWALSQKLHGERFFRFVVFAPIVLSVAVVALMWKFLYHPTLGLIDPALKSMGLGALAKTWLGDPATALPAVAFTSVWHAIGIWVVLLCAGFERLPKDVLEAARIDGAGEWRLFWTIMMPMLTGLFRVLIVLWIVQSLQAFAFVFIMTGGGPYKSTEIVSTLMYDSAFERSEFGYAAAMGLVLIVVMLVVMQVVNRVLRRDDVQY